jgi:trehalose utilization protein
MLTPDDVEQTYSMPKRRQRYLRSTGRLPYFRIGHRTVMYAESDIRKMFSKARVEAYREALNEG